MHLPKITQLVPSSLACYAIPHPGTSYSIVHLPRSVQHPVGAQVLHISVWVLVQLGPSVLCDAEQPPPSGGLTCPVLFQLRSVCHPAGFLAFLSLSPDSRPQGVLMKWGKGGPMG